MSCYKKIILYVGVIFLQYNVCKNKIVIYVVYTMYKSFYSYNK